MILCVAAAVTLDYVEDLNATDTEGYTCTSHGRVPAVNEVADLQGAAVAKYGDLIEGNSATIRAEELGLTLELLARIGSTLSLHCEVKLEHT